MEECIGKYIAELNKCYATGVAREHAYRPAMQTLVQSLLTKSYTVVNEPARTECGAPDFIILKGDTPMAFIEAKDLQDADLDGKKEHKEQFERYRNSLDHIVFTDYLDFHLYEYGEYVDAVRLADIRGGKIVLLEEAEDKFLQMMRRLADAAPQRITSPSRLAKVMASKARLLANVIEQALANDKEQTSELSAQMMVFQEYLIHDLNEKTFSDIYAQTIAYGLFSARLNDLTPEDFSRNEANELIPRSNPLLRKIFNDIAGYNVDHRIAWIIDDLVVAFRVTDMSRVMRDFKQSTQQSDPLMHFYEDFLGEYDPSLKKSRGVYYTPQPVVEFIVRAVDDILKRYFGLPMGLADSSMIEHEVVNEQYVKVARFNKKIPETVKKRMHRVQILDPATGTGTFLAAAIRQIYANMEGQRGAWNSYVEQHLLPRLNGFELMMASYTVAHLKLNMVLRETGYTPQSDQRLRVYLTNSLEEFNADTGTLFSAAISQEAADASRIKRDTPVMVMIGNPPYSISSSNNSDYILRLLNDYKKDLNERNIQPLSNDYVKFIRIGQEYISRTGEGILAFICDNSFIDSITFRQMRKELMQKFDDVYILNLHGNSHKNETAPDGTKDENVFDIMQGVSISIFVKRPTKTDVCKVNYYDVFGVRENKYSFLNDNDMTVINWTIVNPEEPYFFFVPKDFSEKKEYEKGFRINDLMTKYNNGIESGKDDFFFAFNEYELTDNLVNAFDHKDECIRKYDFKDTDNYRLLSAFLSDKYDKNLIRNVSYRPFDERICYYSPYLQRRPAYDIMKNMFYHNIGLLVPRQVNDEFYHVFVSSKPTNCNLTGTAKKFGSAPLFPLYLYSEDGTVREPNLNRTIVDKIADDLNLAFVKDDNIVVELQAGYSGTLYPRYIINYIYGVLHSPAYRAKYKEFLKIDFPRIPYPKTLKEFHHFEEIGEKLIRLHLMEEVPQSKYAQYNNPGGNMVDKPTYKDGCVWINKEQCFADVPELAWNFYIGGYQPAQKWLKDRKGRTLTFDDISHYRQIITILLETDRLMKQIDQPTDSIVTEE